MIPDEDADLNEALVELQFYLPTVLREVYDHWRWEAMDGFRPPVLRKTGPRQMELIGLVSLLPDCDETPIHFHVQVAADGQDIVWLECRVGERGYGRGGMKLHRWGAASTTSLYRKFDRPEALDDIDWVYRVTFGERQG
jgi:hypothetical protein